MICMYIFIIIIAVKQLNHFLVIIFNFLMTVIGSFAASYKITEFVLDVPNVPMVSAN